MNLLELAAELKLRGGRLDQMDLTDELVQARAWIGQDTLDNFLAEHAPDGTPWPARKHHYTWPMLRKTGTMMRRVLEQIDQAPIAGNALRIRIVYPFYSAIHQKGTATIDARRWFGMTSETKQRILDMIGAALSGKAKGST